MGIFDSLYTGVSGLNAAQIQIQVTGQNITNVNSDYYTRKGWTAVPSMLAQDPVGFAPTLLTLILLVLQISS